MSGQLNKAQLLAQLRSIAEVEAKQALDKIPLTKVQQKALARKEAREHAEVARQQRLQKEKKQKEHRERQDAIERAKPKPLSKAQQKALKRKQAKEQRDLHANQRQKVIVDKRDSELAKRRRQDKYSIEINGKTLYFKNKQDILLLLTKL